MSAIILMVLWGWVSCLLPTYLPTRYQSIICKILDELNISAFDDFAGPYTGSREEPDWALIPITDSLPTIVAETGLSDSESESDPQDSWRKLTADRRLWLKGQPNVQLVLLVNFSRQANDPNPSSNSDLVAGEIRLYERARTAAGNIPNERFRANILPIHQGDDHGPGTGPVVIPVTRGEIFGGSGVFEGQGQNAMDVWHLSLARLRQTADRWIRAMGLVPA
ncbi:uncharacterized protein BDV14DRAFT_169934 [Aspergillus stella-maris]|uniref:uncharacterized protein n=1 Tax=Aspergillus stella-maris TaxID=1810926 RepID=UPI003CCE2FE5